MAIYQNILWYFTIYHDISGCIVSWPLCDDGCKDGFSTPYGEVKCNEREEFRVVGSK